VEGVAFAETDAMKESARHEVCDYLRSLGYDVSNRSS
jgi:hypothetical protein